MEASSRADFDGVDGWVLARQYVWAEMEGRVRRKIQK